MNYFRELNITGNTITEVGGNAIVDGMMHNRTLKRLKTKLNPMGYKNNSEIVTLLDINVSKSKKEFKPKIETQIKDLQLFENRRDSVF